MATVNSVLGPLDTADLGFTLTHEHIFTASAGIQQTFPELFGDFDKLIFFVLFQSESDISLHWILRAAKQPPHRLRPCFSEQIPQRNLNPAQRMRGTHHFV